MKTATLRTNPLEFRFFADSSLILRLPLEDSAFRVSRYLAPPVPNRHPTRYLLSDGLFDPFPTLSRVVPVLSCDLFRSFA